MGIDARLGLPMTEPHPIVLFDGECQFCDGAVNWIIDRDAHCVLRFAPLQSDSGMQLRERFGLLDADLDSLIVVDQDRSYLHSSAALRIARYLPWPWRALRAFWLVPKFVRDAAYRLFARNRYRWFGRMEVCRMPTPELRSRFLS
ncbi:MAG: putative DCC family thiol-disulfide oxidoreductase YuxK [Bradymonadia bacterium]|jgi:predicted DCC family thiol-disulfide oxidoreductase YuxK